MAKKPSRSAAVKRADTWFSRFVRKSASMTNGGVRCFTCGMVGDWKHEMQAGHFQSRAKYSIRWSELNVKPQCVRCNISNGGQQYTFGIRLDQTHGEGTAQRLVQEGMVLKKWTTQEIVDIADSYREKFNSL